MRKRKKIIISIFSLALCILVTFAWINEMQNPSGQVLTLRMKDAVVADSNLQVRLTLVNEDEEVNSDITDYVEEGEDPEGKLTPYDAFAPGSRKKFKVEITNLGDTSVRLRMSLLDIICEDEELQNCIIIGTNGFEGFNSNYPPPRVVTKMLADGMDDSGAFTLVESVEIPPHSTDENGNDKSVSIFFYVMFSASGSRNLEDKSFSIGKINFLTL